MAKGDIHTVHRDGRWYNEVQGGQHASNSATRKEEAQPKGRQMAIQGGVGSNGPASAAVRIAVLAASLPAAIGGHNVSVETATTLVAATQLAPMIANLTISVVVLGLTLRTVSPRRVLAFVTKS